MAYEILPEQVVYRTVCPPLKRSSVLAGRSRAEKNLWCRDRLWQTTYIRLQILQGGDLAWTGKNDDVREVYIFRQFTDGLMIPVHVSICLRQLRYLQLACSCSISNGLTSPAITEVALAAIRLKAFPKPIIVVSTEGNVVSRARKP